MTTIELTDHKKKTKIKKKQKMHYDDVRGDDLLSPHDTTPAAVMINKF